MASRDLSNEVTFDKRSERNGRGRATWVSGKRVFQEEEIFKGLK